MDADYLFYMKSIATYAPAFLRYNNSVLARVLRNLYYCRTGYLDWEYNEIFFMKFPTVISDYLLLTGGSGYKADLIHLVTDDQESCVLTDSTILDNMWYATGGIYKKDIYSCGGSLARAGAASVESYNCAIYSNEPDTKPIVIPLRQSRIKASSAILEDKIYIVGKYNLGGVNRKICSISFAKLAFEIF